MDLDETTPIRFLSHNFLAPQLQVRVIVHSSLHSQNEVLSEFLGQEPDFPRLSNIPGDNFVSNLRMRRDVLKEQSEIQYAKAPQHAEDKLLESTIDITKHQLCSLPRSTNHLLRIMSVLWKALITGNGKPDLVWANPSAPLPLRVHCFATILHLLGAASLYMSKNGVTQVDGVSKWNVVTLGRVLALCFDEAKLFGHQAVEAFDGEEWMPSEPPATTPPDHSTCPLAEFHPPLACHASWSATPAVPQSCCQQHGAP